MPEHNGNKQSNENEKIQHGSQIHIGFCASTCLSVETPGYIRFYTVSASFIYPTKRSYQHARSHHQALEIIDSEAETKLDPWVIGRFKPIIERCDYRVH